MSLPEGTRIASVTLTVNDLARSVAFYRDLAGLRVLTSDANSATLGAGDTPLVRLDEERGAMRSPARASGLYHTAILYPDRAALARTIRHIASREYPFTGASDHLVSEAFYLDDPDGHGVELYRDRPRNEWRRQGDTIEMASLPLDVDDLLGAADRAFDGAPGATRIGHVHLRVSDIAQAESFYVGVVGFSVKARFGGSATFLAGGDYHHHLGANIWQSRGAQAAPEGHVRLRGFMIEVPQLADVEAVAGRAASAGIKAVRNDRSIVLTDPWSQRVVLSAS